MSISEPCMCGDPACGICGPLQGYGEEDEQLREELLQQKQLVVQLGMMIRHIADHNSFDKQDLIQLLKRAKNWINNTPIGN